MQKILSFLVAFLWDGAFPVPRPALQRLAYYGIPLLLIATTALTWHTPEALYPFAKKSGSIALLLIFGILAVAPLVRIMPTLGFLRLVMSYRRELGIISAWFVLAHFAGLAHGADMLSLQGLSFMATGENPLLTSGTIAAIGMAILAFTSNDIALRTLGRNWKRLHRIVYAVLFIALMHASMAGGETTKGLVIFGIYLVLRVIAARGWHVAIPRPAISA